MAMLRNHVRPHLWVAQAVTEAMIFFLHLSKLLARFEFRSAYSQPLARLNLFPIWVVRSTRIGRLVELKMDSDRLSSVQKQFLLRIEEKLRCELKVVKLKARKKRESTPKS
jgi:hypothetical protein